MHRTLRQEMLYVGGWTAALLCCLFTGLAAYTVGYFDGCEDSSPRGRRMVPFTAHDVVHAMSIAIGAKRDLMPILREPEKD